MGHIRPRRIKVGNNVNVRENAQNIALIRKVRNGGKKSVPVKGKEDISFYNFGAKNRSHVTCHKKGHFINQCSKKNGKSKHPQMQFVGNADT